MALNDAKSKLGQVVNSRVESVHRDFLASGNMSEGEGRECPGPDREG